VVCAPQIPGVIQDHPGRLEDANSGAQLRTSVVKRPKRRVPTVAVAMRENLVGTAQVRLCPPYTLRRYFFTSGHSLASSGFAASSGEMVAISL